MAQSSEVSPLTKEQLELLQPATDDMRSDDNENLLGLGAPLAALAPPAPTGSPSHENGLSVDAPEEAPRSHPPRIVSNGPPGEVDLNLDLDEAIQAGEFGGCMEVPPGRPGQEMDDTGIVEDGGLIEGDAFFDHQSAAGPAPAGEAKEAAAPLPPPGAKPEAPGPSKPPKSPALPAPHPLDPPKRPRRKAAELVPSREELDGLEGALAAFPPGAYHLLEPLAPEELSAALVSQAVLQEGRPLIVRKVTESWKKELFSWYWLRDNSGDTYISPRNLQTLVDLQGWTMREYINYFLQEEKDRLVELYGKDASCPPEWSKYISDKLKPYSCHESSDLLADLPKELQPETLMLYIGMENTFTPGHIDTCASVGQNLMAHGDPDAYALWILFATQDRDKARELWSAYGGDIEEDNCYLPMEELKNSKAKFYVFRQRPGDLVFVPPDSVHQVVNKGGRSLKVAWNRIFPSTVEQSYESLLSYHKYQKPPVFRVKALAFCGAKNRIKGLKEKEQVEEGDRVAVRNELVPLLKLLKVIVNEEFVSEKAIKEMGEWEVMNYEDTLAHSRRCNICHADIFNRCYKCPVCEDFDVCFHCICEGRGCKLKNTHRKKYILAENIPMKELMRVVEEGEELVRKVIGEEVEGVKGKEDSIATLAFRKVTKQKQNEKKLQAKKSKAKKKGSSSDTDEDKKVKKKKRTSSDVPKANKKKKSSKRSKTENIEQQLKKRKLSKDSKTKSKRRKASSDSDYEDKEPKNSQKRKYDSSMEEEEEYEEKRENKKKKRSSSNLKNTKKAVAKRSRDEAEKIETSKKAADVEDSEAGSLRRRKSKKHKDDMFYYEAMPETSESEEEEYSEEDSEFKLVTQKKPKKEKKVVSAAKPKKKVEDKQTTPKTTPKKSSSNSSSQKSMRFFSYIPIDVPPATSSVVPPEGPPNTGAPPSYPAVHFPQNQPPPPHILQRSDPYLTNPLLDPESPLTIQPLIQPAPFLPSSFQSPWAQPPPVPLSENNY